MKHLLLSRTDRIGDVVLTTATFAPLRKQFPEARLRILVRPELASLLAADSRVEAVPCPPEPGPGGLHWGRFRHWLRFLRADRPDGAVFLHPDNDLQLAAAFAGIPRRIGYRRQLGRLGLTEAIPHRRHLGHRHEAACNFDLLERIGCPAPAEIRPALFLPPPKSSEAGDQDRRPYAVFHPAAFGEKPRWPSTHYARLGVALHKQYGWRIILAGGEPHPEAVASLRTHGLPEDVWTDRGGIDDLPATAHLLAKAKIVVSRDSGPAHLAAALKTPLVCLMGQCDPIHSPSRWAPIGEKTRTLISDLPRHRGETRKDRWDRCFASITPEQVIEAVRDLIQ